MQDLFKYHPINVFTGAKVDDIREPSMHGACLGPHVFLIFYWGKVIVLFSFRDEI